MADVGSSGNSGFTPSESSPIIYHGWPIIQHINVAVIYWSNNTIFQNGPAPGTTGLGSADQSLVGFFLNNLGGTSHWNINWTYYEPSTGRHVENTVTYSGYWASNTNVPPYGSRVSEGTIRNRVQAALNSGALPYDPSTVYVVFTGSLVWLDEDGVCAYHNSMKWNGHDVYYAYVPFALEHPGCTWTDTYGSPNNDAAADAVLSGLVHEIEETATDPIDRNGWVNVIGNHPWENADKCRTALGSIYFASGDLSSYANVNIGGRNFMLQGNWVNDEQGGHSCALELYNITGPAVLTDAGTHTWTFQPADAGAGVHWQHRPNGSNDWLDLADGQTLSMTRNAGEPTLQTSLRATVSMFRPHPGDPGSYYTPVVFETPPFALTWAPPGSALPVSVSLSGPTIARPNVACWFTATAQNGTPPYTFSWGGYTETTDGSSTVSWGGGADSYTVTVSITDANGGTAWAELGVTVDENYPSNCGN